MCSHDVEIRKRTFEDSTVHYGRQCVACLASVPTDGRTWVDRDDGQRDLFGDESTR